MKRLLLVLSLLFGSSVAAQSFNVWTPQGQLAGLTTKSNPSVIYESGCVVLSSPCFKMWVGGINNAGGVYYYESVDGLTSWTAHPSNPIVSTVAVPAGQAFPTVYHIGSTYYLYYGYTAIDVRTSSDGITFGSATVIINLGGGGSWDDTHVAQLNIVPGTPNYGAGGGETYYGYYEGITGAGSGEGLVTATNPAGPWTKSGSNPIFAVAPPMTLQKVGGTYYAWIPGVGLVRRWSSAKPDGPWTKLQSGGSDVFVNYPTLVADINSPDTTKVAYLGDPSILEANGNCYLYWTKTYGAGLQTGVNASVATGTTLAKLVTGLEGVVGFPIPVLTVNLNALGSDTFQRANANPIGGNWSPLVAGKTAQIVSNLVESSATSSSADSYWNAASFPNDQWSKITLDSLITGSLEGAQGRMSTSGASTGYIGFFNATLGTAGTLTIEKFVAGTGTVLSTLTSFTVSSGQTLMLAESGSNLLLYWVGVPVLAANDAAIASGAAGFEMFTGAALVNAKISAWSGGGFQAAPLLASGAGVGGNAGVGGVAGFSDQ